MTDRRRIPEQAQIGTGRRDVRRDVGQATEHPHVQQENDVPKMLITSVINTQ